MDLAKKYKSFAQDYLALLDELENNPFSGQSLGNHVYKYRMAISSKGKGKSGGARVIAYNLQEKESGHILITLMTIYDKNEISNVSDAYLKSLVKSLSNRK